MFFRQRENSAPEVRANGDRDGCPNNANPIRPTQPSSLPVARAIRPQPAEFADAHGSQACTTTPAPLPFFSKRTQPSRAPSSIDASNLPLDRATHQSRERQRPDPRTPLALRAPAPNEANTAQVVRVARHTPPTPPRRRPPLELAMVKKRNEPKLRQSLQLSDLRTQAADGCATPRAGAKRSHPNSTPQDRPPPVSLRPFVPPSLRPCPRPALLAATGTIAILVRRDSQERCRRRPQHMGDP